MKIATWNVERLKHKKLLDEMLHSIDEVNADILVLTETDQRLHPKYRFCYETPGMAICQPDIYAPTENRVSIYTNYPCVRQHSTYDENTALCVELETEKGNLIVYGTIIGIYGNRHQTFLSDLMKQMDDLRRLSKLGVAMTVVLLRVQMSIRLRKARRQLLILMRSSAILTDFTQLRKTSSITTRPAFPKELPLREKQCLSAPIAR